ncbi:MAG: pseudaminic acid synthase [Planctomycetaceae bacterium]|nr:pseudaminic acid synthase [Planctomycetaceae bacterium]
MPRCFSIAGHSIGPGAPVFIVAELSANHRGSLDEARQLIRAAADAGADAVKLQTYTADTLTIDSARQWFQIEPGTLWSGRTLYDLYQEAYTPWDWHPELKSVAEQCGLTLFSTPFDLTAVAFLEQLALPAHKIASFELVDLPLVTAVAQTGKPLIVSTGMADWNEIDEAVAAIRATGNEQFALLKCTSAYPAPLAEMNLRVLPRLAERYGVPVGLSDHSPGHTAAVAAVALGASIIEKHFTLDRRAGGPDAAFSLEPGEFRALVNAVRATEAALGSDDIIAGPAEQKSRVFRRSLFVVADMQAGDEFTAANVRSIRPGHGLPPKHLAAVLGRRAKHAIERGTPLAWDMIA